MESALLKHFALFPPGAGEAVVAAWRVAPLLEAAERPDARVRILHDGPLTSSSGQPTTSTFFHQYAYVHDYVLLPEFATEMIGIFTYGEGTTIRGEVCGDRVRLMQADYLDIIPVRFTVSAFQRERITDAGRREVATYPVEEPEFEQRLDQLSKPVLLDPDDELLMLVPPVELHRLLAPAARSQDETQTSHAGASPRAEEGPEPRGLQPGVRAGGTRRGRE